LIKRWQDFINRGWAFNWGVPLPTNKDKTPIHEIFKILYEESPDAIYLYDLEGNYLEGNTETERIVGYKKEELIGRNFIEMNIIPKSEIHKAIQSVQDNAQGKSSGPKEFTLVRKNGEKVIVEMRTYPFTFHGKPLIMGVARDITDRKKAEEKLLSSENRYRSIFENANDGILLLSIETGEIIDVNQNLCDLLKVSKKECVEKNISIFNKKITNFESDITLDWIIKSATDGPSIFEVLMRNFENEKIWVEVSLNLLNIDNEKIVLSIVRKIHDRKIMENKLNALYQHSTLLGEATTIEDISTLSLKIENFDLLLVFTIFVPPRIGLLITCIFKHI
jgi:PAS domain S-box-containing protein